MKCLNCNALAGAAIALALTAIFALLPATLEAQSFYGSVVGTVTDTSGAIIPGATVTVTNIGTNEKRSADTDAAGNYRFVNLVPANYRLEVEKAGFKRITREPISVRVEGAVRIDVVLEVGAINETVEVSSSTPLLQTETGTLSQVVEGQQVQEMPLNGRNPMNLIALTSGVVPQGSSQGGTAMNQGTHTNTAGWGNYQIGGGIAGQSGMLIDGAPVNVLGNNTIALVPTQDAVQEFRVATNSVSAEFGRFGGGVVNMTTKSGANGFHGSAYEYLRNNVFNANDFFSNLNGQDRPKWNQNQFGVVGSGPVVKDKAFFFFSWEGLHSRIGYPSSTNVPTDDMRNGTFYKPIVDPTGRGCVSHPSSTVWQITPSCIDATAKYITNYYFPEPNAIGQVNNYFATPIIGNDANQYNGRFDYNIGNRQRLFGRFTYWGMTDIPFNQFNNATGNANSSNRTHQFVLGDTYSFSATTVLDFRASYLREYYDNRPPSLGTDLSQFGPAYADMASQVTYQENPAIHLMGPNGLYMFFPMTVTSFSYWNTYGLAYNLTKIVGKHNLKFGGEFRLADDNATSTVMDASGAFSFDPSLTGDEFASFLLGIPTQGSIGTLAPVSNYNYYQGYYATDSWQVSKKVTLTLGLRWELPGAIAEKHDRATVLLPSAVDPVTNVKGTLALVNSALYPDRALQEVKYHLFAPRFGFAYRMTEQTVLRGGYGLSYISPDIPMGMLASYSVVNSADYSWVNSPGSITHFLGNPFPNGFNYPVGRDPNFMKSWLGQSISGPLPYQAYPYVQQWNLSLGRQLAGDWMLEIGYAGAKGTNLPTVGSSSGGIGLNELSSQYWSMGAALLAPSSTDPTMTVGQSLMPYPQYRDFINNGYYGGTSNYHSMQLRVEKRFHSGGMVMANYTWSKSLGDTDSANSFLEAKASSGPGMGGAGFIQDFNNLKEDYSLSSYDVPQRLIISYVYDLPFGNGKKFAHYAGAAGALVSGWSINGITNFQNGFPLTFYSNGNNLTRYFGAGTLRPNVVSGCNAAIAGSAQSRINGWFNTNCFVYPGDYSLGNEARVDPQLRSQGVNNFDFAVMKETKIKEDANIQFRTEFFNLFNRVQFSPPATTVDGGNFGKVLSQLNQPRLIQFSLRLNY